MAQPALSAFDLVRSLGGRRVLDGVSLTAAPGRRIGLIGENGAGKSTLLRLLAGVDEPDGGAVTRPADLGFLHQEMPFDPAATIADVLDEALREAREDLADLDRLTAALAATPPDGPDQAGLLAAYGARLDRAQDHDAWDADRRAEITLAGLGLGGIGTGRTLATLSGGQRARLALAALLVRRPTALLLDEPTNHLDDDAAAFLEEQLRALPGAVVAASHDRAFLDAVCTDLIDLDPAVDGPTRYGGGYTAYLAAKQAERDRWERRFADEQSELAALRQSVATTSRTIAANRGPRDNNRMSFGLLTNRVEQQISRRVRNAGRRLDELERAQVRRPPPPLRFAAPALASPSPEGTLLALRDVMVPGRLTLDRFDLTATDRVLVTGPNGAGKSTLLAVLAGHLAAGGEVRRRGSLRIGLLAQDSVFDRPERTAADTYARAVGPRRAEAVPLVDLGLLAPRELGRPVGELSAGQRRRLALALLIADPPELLLLDEPTNHLSPRLADELQNALGPGPGPGAIVVASHDRWLRSRWPGRELRLPAPA
ncbi:ABC-F family ATP-binding cassette domain-containing protein [Frankia tisae]|uniref:ABC-F family ATP-binding cassette domain-containing protein n=1 Tax=Frankia tisae TaxID=2950104 RepID=UPI0021C0D788|nr:ABC-F family ATP-binding cassette domain-containing protein [Frankia tisae]